jgi:hypothetical protein
MTDDPRFEVFGAHGASLRDELRGVFIDERLREWAGGIEPRRDFLADMILGTVEWTKRSTQNPSKSEDIKRAHDSRIMAIKVTSVRKPEQGASYAT